MPPSDKAEAVVIVDYDPRWPAAYEAEKERLLAVVGPYVEQIEHMGSTAVPGLAAKPIIDMMIGVKQLTVAARCIELMVALGYAYVPEFEDEMPERRYFRRGMPRTHQIHLVELHSPFWVRHLAFRDYLRAHPEDAAAYAALKRGLAGRFRDDRAGYTDAKTDFIRGIEAKIL